MKFLKNGPVHVRVDSLLDLLAVLVQSHGLFHFDRLFLLRSHDMQFFGTVLTYACSHVPCSYQPLLLSERHLVLHGNPGSWGCPRPYTGTANYYLSKLLILLDVSSNSFHPFRIIASRLVVEGVGHYRSGSDDRHGLCNLRVRSGQGSWSFGFVYLNPRDRKSVV